MDDIKELIIVGIKELVGDAPISIYREPIVGFADAGDPEFGAIRDITHAKHLLPKEWMPQGKTIVSFFIPFTKELMEENRRNQYVAKDWAIAYIETNKLIKDIGRTMAERLKEYNIETVWQLPADSFDDQKLMACWSQRHIAYIAGLGTFGINNMLITDKGCSGRYGSFIIDYYIQPTPRNKKEKCLYKLNGGCGKCMALCPVQALTPKGFDRNKCNQRVWEVNAFYNDLEECDCCGKCLLGPCAIWDRKEDSYA